VVTETRTWAYGTIKNVSVVHVGRAGVLTVVGLADCESLEGFLLLMQRHAPEPAVGDLGTITFRRGGPTGGYWDFRRVD
jgi:hypothetical protein